MRESQPQTEGRDPIRHAVLTGLFGGTTVGVGYLLAGVPNVEAMTLVTALAGVALGAAGGALCGALAMAVYALANPLGAVVPLILVAQCTGLAVAGLGGRTGWSIVASSRRRGRHLRAALAAGVFGAVLTLIFDGLTNLAVVGALRMDWRTVMVGAIPFTAWHAGTNALFFGALFPRLAERVSLLTQSALRGTGALLLFVALTAGGVDPVRAQEAEAPADSTAANGLALAAGDTLAAPAAAARAVGDTLATPTPAAQARAARARAAATTARRNRQRARDWQRPLWEPFPRGFLDEVLWRTPWFPVMDAGLGGAAVLVNEGGTAAVPQIVRDGVPQLVGHRLIDSPWIIPVTGLELTAIRAGRDGWGAMDGAIVLATRDLDPTRAVADSRWDQADRDQNLRSFVLLTADAPWRLQFAFEELIDEDGWDFRPPGDLRFQNPGAPLGNAKFRTGRGFLQRVREDGAVFTLVFENLRLTRVGLPAYDRRQQEIWSRQLSGDWHGPVGGGWCRVTMWWTDRDAEFNEVRLIEVAREGLRIELADAVATPDRRFWALVSNWRLHDSGTSSAWAGPFRGATHGKGSDAQFGGELGRSWWGLRSRAGAAALWSEPGGWAPEAWVSLAEPGAAPWWRVELEVGGRAPRSDELLTPWNYAVPGRDILTRPAPGLKREKTGRAALCLERRLLGIDLAADAALRWIRDGIVWRPTDPDAGIGSWTNAAEFTARTLRVSARHGLRFLGWLRLRSALTWRGVSERGGSAAGEPPDFDARAEALWENHFFREDGILQLGYRWVHRGGMADPWSFDAAYGLPALTRHDLLVGFRLLGADLSLAIVNLTDKRARLSAGAESYGRELQWRLHWRFYR